jgi:membrane associated rhomboid family serine protease
LTSGLHDATLGTLVARFTQNRSAGFSSGPPTAGPVTRILCVLILAVTLIGTLTERKLGFGISDLNFDVQAVLAGQVWRVITYPFVESQAWNLIISLVILWMFGGSFESRWGERDFARFFVVAAAGAAVLAIPLTYLVNAIFPFTDMGAAEGPWTVINAMFVALALTNPDSNVLLGFILPIRARTLVYFILGMQIVIGIMTGAAALSTTIGGMVMGYLLVTGNWRPGRWLGAFRLPRKKRRTDIYVVPPRDRTLH